jgi:hypothetical protein
MRIDPALYRLLAWPAFAFGLLGPFFLTLLLGRSGALNSGSWMVLVIWLPLVALTTGRVRDAGDDAWIVIVLGIALSVVPAALLQMPPSVTQDMLHSEGERATAGFAVFVLYLGAILWLSRRVRHLAAMP